MAHRKTTATNTRNMRPPLDASRAEPRYAAGLRENIEKRGMGNGVGMRNPVML